MRRNAGGTGGDESGNAVSSLLPQSVEVPVDRIHQDTSSLAGEQSTFLLGELRALDFLW